MKNSAKYCTHKPSSEPVWKTPNRPPNINVYLLHLWRPVAGKEGGLRTQGPFSVKEIGDGRYFDIGRLITPIKNLSLNLRNYKYIVVDALTYRPILRDTTLMQI